MKPTENELREGILNGDSKTIQYIYDNIFPKINYRLTQAFGTSQYSEDAMQESLVILINSLKEGKSIPSIFSFLSFFSERIYQFKYIKNKRYYSLPSSEVELLLAKLESKEDDILKQPIETLYQIGTIKIDGNWSTAEMGHFLINLNIIYQIKSLAIANLFDISKKFQSFIENPDKVKISSDLKLLKIHYSSPGSIDILGIGVVLKEIKEFIFYLCEKKQNSKLKQIEIELKKEELNAKRLGNKQNSKLKQIEIESKKEELKAKRIGNIEKFLELKKNSNLPIDTINQLTQFIEPKREEIIKLIEDNKIKEIEIKPVKEKDS